MNEFFEIIEQQDFYWKIGKADGKINMAISSTSTPQEFRKFYWDGFVLGLLQKFHRKNLVKVEHGFYVRVFSSLDTDIAGHVFKAIIQTDSHYYLLDPVQKFHPFWIEKKFCYKYNG